MPLVGPPAVRGRNASFRAVLDGLERLII